MNLDKINKSEVQRKKELFSFRASMKQKNKDEMKRMNNNWPYPHSSLRWSPTHTHRGSDCVCSHTHLRYDTGPTHTRLCPLHIWNTERERASSVWLLSAHWIMRSHLCPLKPGLQVQSGPPDPSLQTPPCSHCKSTSHRRGGNRHLTEEWSHLLYHISSILNTSKQGSFLFIRINTTDNVYINLI